MNKLVDSFGRTHNYLRISVTDRCNLRCIYCMPSNGIKLRKHSEIMTFEEISKIVKIFSELGINKLRITGGEPLVRKNLPELISNLRNISGIEKIGLTTNGTLLKENILSLKNSGLDNINISLDTLDEKKFQSITLRSNFYDVIDSIEKILDEDLFKIKLNVVVMKDINDSEILNFVEFVRDKIISVRFIEFMPFRYNGWSELKFVPFSVIKSKIEEKYNLIRIYDQLESTAKNYSITGFKGTIGFITSVSEHFCSSCSRLRLTSEGKLKTCLFYPAETNLRDLLRSGVSEQRIKEIIQATVNEKRFSHPDIANLENFESNSMIEIGG